jgi:hypothetical protein
MSLLHISICDTLVLQKLCEITSGKKRHYGPGGPGRTLLCIILVIQKRHKWKYVLITNLLFNV